MRGFPCVIGHLRRKYAALGQGLDKAPHDHLVIRHPLEHGVGKQQIDRFLRCPSCKVGLNEHIAWQPLARLPQHVLGRIQSNDGGVRIAVYQKFGRIAWPAAQIDRHARLLQGHLSKQITRRARPLLFKFQVLACVPVT